MSDMDGHMSKLLMFEVSSTGRELLDLAVHHFRLPYRDEYDLCFAELSTCAFPETVEDDDVLTDDSVGNQSDREILPPGAGGQSIRGELPSFIHPFLHIHPSIRSVIH